MNNSVSPARRRDRRVSIINKSVTSHFARAQNIDEQYTFKELLRLESGSSFGELALLNHKPRAARVLTETKCEFATMNKESYDRILAKIEQILKEKTVSFLRSIPLYSTWPNSHLQRMIYNIDRRKVLKDESIVQEGKPVNRIYIIKFGEFLVTKR